MTRDETKEILMMVIAYFPNFKVIDKTVTLNAWHLILADYDCDLVKAGLIAYVSTNTSGFAPNPGQLINAINIAKPTMPNEMEAWSMVSKAIRNGYYHAEEEYEKLPDAVKKAVGDPSNLRNWATTDVKSIENVVQSNFQRTYRAVCDREAQVSVLPTCIKERLGVNEAKGIGVNEDIQSG